jgi:hypothetical protein
MDRVLARLSLVLKTKTSSSGRWRGDQDVTDGVYESARRVQICN